MKHLAAKVTLLSLTLSSVGQSCRSAPPRPPEAPPKQQSAPRPASEDVPTYSYEVVNVWPHDPKAFTQGLVFDNGTLLESTGQIGSSSLRRVELQTGKIVEKVDVPPPHFAEGIALFRDKVYQLTWQSQKGFIYDPVSFARQGEFIYGGEGWGLTHDGSYLIMSDGTNQIRFLNPTTFAIERTIEVYDRGRPLRDLNELEYVKGEIFANVWHSDRIARIDPASGRILGWIDLAGLLPAAEQRDPEAVLNGIAYDAGGDRLFITGKLWPKLFEIRLKKAG